MRRGLGHGKPDGGEKGRNANRHGCGRRGSDKERSAATSHMGVAGIAGAGEIEGERTYQRGSALA
jgi:hypothetical protein